MVLPLVNTKLWSSKEGCYNFFFKKKTKEFAIEYDKIVSYYRYNYSFLTNQQIQGKVYNYLNIPNVCGKINRKKLRSLIKEEKKPRKSYKQAFKSKRNNKVNNVEDSDDNIEHVTKLYSQNSNLNSTIDTFVFTPESYNSNSLAVGKTDHCNQVQQQLSKLKIATSNNSSGNNEIVSIEPIYDPITYATSDDNCNKYHLDGNRVEKIIFMDMSKRTKPLRTYSRADGKNVRNSLSGTIYKTDSDLELDLYCTNSENDCDDSSIIYSGELYIDQNKKIVSTKCYSSSNESSTVKNPFNHLEKRMKLNLENNNTVLPDIFKFLRNSNDEPISQAKNILDIFTSGSSFDGYLSDIPNNRKTLNLKKQITNIITGTSESELAVSDIDKHVNNKSVWKIKKIIGTTDEECTDFKPETSSVSPFILVEKSNLKPHYQGIEVKQEKKGRFSKFKTRNKTFYTNFTATERSSVAHVGTMVSANKLDEAKHKLLKRRLFYLK